VTDSNGNSTDLAPSTARRVLDVLFALTDSADGMSVRGIAEQIGSSRSSTHRILRALSEDGYVEQKPDGGYVVGVRMVELGARVFGVVPLLRYADELMRRLVTKVAETAYLATFDRESLFATFVHRVESTRPIRHVQPLGTRIPLHAGAVGKAILYADPSIDLADLPLPGITPHTIVDRKVLEADLAKSRERGYAISREERVEGIIGVAAPLISGDVVLGGLAVAIPVGHEELIGVDHVGELVRGCASDISATLNAMGISRL
jgi:IclR family transcriptional regulator, acetate operon repressor